MPRDEKGRYESEKDHTLRRFRERYGARMKPSEWTDICLQIRKGTALVLAENEYQVFVRGYQVRAVWDGRVVVTVLPPTPEQAAHNRLQGWPPKPHYAHFVPHGQSQPARTPRELGELAAALERVFAADSPVPVERIRIVTVKPTDAEVAAHRAQPLTAHSPGLEPIRTDVPFVRRFRPPGRSQP